MLLPPALAQLLLRQQRHPGSPLKALGRSDLPSWSTQPHRLTAALHTRWNTPTCSLIPMKRLRRWVMMRVVRKGVVQPVRHGTGAFDAGYHCAGLYDPAIGRAQADGLNSTTLRGATFACRVA